MVSLGVANFMLSHLSGFFKPETISQAIEYSTEESITVIQKTTTSCWNNLPKTLQPTPMLANTRPPLSLTPQGRLD